MPKISVIICAYNSERYINRCLESLRIQSFTDYEVIIVNDGSTDNTQNIVDNYSINDKHICSINQSHKGISESKKKGINLAHGDYVFFMDSDDTLNPNTL